MARQAHMLEVSCQIPIDPLSPRSSDKLLPDPTSKRDIIRLVKFESHLNEVIWANVISTDLPILQVVVHDVMIARVLDRYGHVKFLVLDFVRQGDRW